MMATQCGSGSSHCLTTTRSLVQTPFINIIFSLCVNVFFSKFSTSSNCPKDVNASVNDSA